MPRPSITLHGIDGCPAGWLVVSQLGNQPISACIYASMDAFAETLGDDDIVAIDMPIGMPSSDSYPRACDSTARTALGRRACCVFSTPCRGVLEHRRSHRIASRWHRQATGKGISCQAFHILPKIQELDTFLTNNNHAPQFHEVHPELCFAYMNGTQEEISPIQTKKSSSEGKTIRARLVENSFPNALDHILSDSILGTKTHKVGGKRKRRWALDDLHDAFASLWTARRIARQQATPYPDAAQNHPPTSLIYA